MVIFVAMCCVCAVFIDADVGVIVGGIDAIGICAISAATRIRSSNSLKNAHIAAHGADLDVAAAVAADIDIFICPAIKISIKGTAHGIHITCKPSVRG